MEVLHAVKILRRRAERAHRKRVVRAVRVPCTAVDHAADCDTVIEIHRIVRCCAVCRVTAVDIAAHRAAEDIDGVVRRRLAKAADKFARRSAT